MTALQLVVMAVIADAGATVAFLIFSHQPTQPARYGRRVVVGDRAATGMTPDPPVPPAPAHTPPVGAGGTTNRKAER